MGIFNRPTQVREGMFMTSLAGAGPNRFDRVTRCRYKYSYSETNQQFVLQPETPKKA